MRFKQWIGIQASSSWLEKLVSGLGALLAISATFYCTDWFASVDVAMALLPSMGASAVLVFAVPHGMLSQPWPLLAGNLVSAVIGVSVALCVDAVYMASGLAVGLAIAAMHLLRCVHPPGGATALVAVIGGDAVRQAGYEFVLMPVLVNCLLLFVIALVYNNFFSWRRYPAALMKYDHSMYHPETYHISTLHIQQALETMDELIDVSAEQVKYLVDKADEIMQLEKMAGVAISIGCYYTNAAAGRRWSVRQVLDISNHPNPARRKVMYRTVDGSCRGESGTVSLYEFQRWAREQMRPIQDL